MTRPHWASLVEDSWNSALGGVLDRRGWAHLMVPLTGYGGHGFVRVLARVVHAPAPDADEPAATARAEQQAYRRGWRNFLTAEVPHQRVTVTLGEDEHEVATDRSGQLDVRLPNPGWAPGWHEVRMRTPKSAPARARILVVDESQPFGLVSDIDDTVLRTYLPRPMVAAYNTFVLPEHARRPVPGMAVLYQEVLRAHPGAPTFYVSTGAWNTASTLERFLATHGYPRGPMLLTDWGPTNTGWFRSGQEHKRASLRGLAADFPGIRWLLVGDDGQHDPELYGEFAREHPGNVRAIAIRELGAGEQVLSHGTPVARAAQHRDSSPPEVPEVRGEDGAALARLLAPLLDLR